jgi:hypothetical protein
MVTCALRRSYSLVILYTNLSMSSSFWTLRRRKSWRNRVKCRTRDYHVFTFLLIFDHNYINCANWIFIYLLSCSNRFLDLILLCWENRRKMPWIFKINSLCWLCKRLISERIEHLERVFFINCRLSNLIFQG